MKTLRETPHFTATETARGVRIEAKECPTRKQARTVSLDCWRQLEPMSDSEFDGSCVLELGIGTFKAR